MFVHLHFQKNFFFKISKENCSLKLITNSLLHYLKNLKNIFKKLDVIENNKYSIRF